MQGMVLGAEGLFCRFSSLQQETCGSLRQREGWMDIQDCFTLNPLSAQHSWTLEMANAQR